MNIIFKNWLDINRESSSESLNSESNFRDSKEVAVDISNKVVALKKELENAEKINNNLKLTIEQLDKKVNRLILENKSYKSIIQVLLFFSVICNIYLYSKSKI